MNTNLLAAAAALSNQDLLRRLATLAGRERAVSVELIAHLAALDSRPAVYAAEGFGSLFTYCTRALCLSEDAACNRIEAARACRRFPVILEMLGSGSTTLTAIRLLGKHLTAENHQDVLARACGRSRREIEALVAELAPRPDVPSSVRKLPTRLTPLAAPMPGLSDQLRVNEVPGPETTSSSTASSNPALSVRAEAGPPQADPAAASAAARPPLPPTPRAIVQATAPERYRVQFTIGAQAHERLRQLQALLRREIPDGDPGAIVERALALLLESVEKAKIGATANPLALPQSSIRPGTDKLPGQTTRDGAQRAARPSRHIPLAVRRSVWRRDAGQCAFVSAGGRTCSHRTFLEFHHIQPYAMRGPATVGNISLRCWRHNQYEAELEFGQKVASVAQGQGRSATVPQPEKQAEAE